MNNTSIENSYVLIEWLDNLIHKINFPANERNHIAGSLFYFALDHHKAIILLNQNRLCGPAFALIRPIFEAYLRGVWVHKCATESQIKICKSDNFPTTKCLISDIEKIGSHGSGTFTRIHEKYYKIMCSYTHGGLQQIIRYMAPTSVGQNFTPDDVDETLNAANLFGCLAALAFANLADDNDFAVTILDRMQQEWPSMRP